MRIFFSRRTTIGLALALCLILNLPALARTDATGLDGARVAQASAAAPAVAPASPAAVSSSAELAPVAAEPAGAAELSSFRIIPDPYERMNRAFWHVNNFITGLIIRPFNIGYRHIVPEPARKSIKKAGYNLAYPVRLCGTLLEGKFHGAGVETGRFLINTTVGIVGLFDPATKIGMKNYDEDFGQAFAHWGAGWWNFLTFPWVGPTSGRDFAGYPFDSVTNLAFWVPGLDFFFEFNELSFELPIFERIHKIESDPYVTDRELWALDRERKVKDLDQHPTPPPATPHLPTLDVVYFKPKDPLFYTHACTRQALIPATGCKLPYSLWLQRQPAPLVIVIDGVGTHRLSNESLAIAELAYNHGYSALTVSNATNWEFMQRAATVTVPGYTPVDAKDTWNALNAIYHDLNEHHPNQVTSTALVGLSLGGMHALFISDLAKAGEGQAAGNLHLDRIVAVNPPVDLVYAARQLDDYYQAPLAWPAGERHDDMLMTLLKAAQLASETIKPGAGLPFDETESRFLIGLAYRVMLRDMIYVSQRRQDLGVVQLTFNKWRRQPDYDRLMKFSYTDYMRQFLLPYYQRQPPGGAPVSPADLITRSNLHSVESGLHDNPNLRVFVNQDDFLLKGADLEWLKATLGDRLTVFPTGGHLGNLYQEPVQAKILDALAGLKK